jgi:hypothetical protein
MPRLHVAQLVGQAKHKPASSTVPATHLLQLVAEVHSAQMLGQPLHSEVAGCMKWPFLHCAQLPETESDSQPAGYEMHFPPVSVKYFWQLLQVSTASQLTQPRPQLAQELFAFKKKPLRQTLHSKELLHFTHPGMQARQLLASMKYRAKHSVHLESSVHRLQPGEQLVHLPSAVKLKPSRQVRHRAAEEQLSHPLIMQAMQASRSSRK